MTIFLIVLGVAEVQLSTGNTKKALLRIVVSIINLFLHKKRTAQPWLRRSFYSKIVY